MAISPNIFEKCVPAISTDVNRCGSVTLCNISQPGADELATFFGGDTETNWKILDALFLVDYEAKACQAKQNGLYDLVTANRTAMPGRFALEPKSKDLIEIKPFINVFRDGIVNNNFWSASNGQANGDNWQVDVVSQGQVPADVRWFPTGLRVFIEGVTAGGTKTYTAWEVVSATAVTTDKVRLVLESQNENSNFTATQLTDPVTGLLIRGVPNVSLYESYCATVPGLNTRQQTPSWIEWTRVSTCQDEIYEKYHRLLKENNPRYKEYGDIETVKRNRQALEDHQISWVNQWFFGKALPNQNENDWTTLEQITVPTNDSLALPFEGRCMGYKANAIGVLEQLKECNRVFDAQGKALNLYELFNALYNIMRVRKTNGGNAKRIDIITDSWFRKQIQQAMIEYFNTISAGLIRFNMELGRSNDLGFDFDVYKLDYPNIEVAFISHEYFDDRVDAMRQATGNESRFLWVIDFADIKTWVFDTDRTVLTSGTPADIAKVDSSQLCIPKRPRQTWTHTSQAWSVFVECPGRHMLVEGISPDKPVYQKEASSSGSGTEYGYQ